MILVDTSVWIDFFRGVDTTLASRLDAGQVLAHPWVIGELALGQLDVRGDELTLMAELPMASVATPEELLHLIELSAQAGSGIGYVDAQLIASAQLSFGASVWTRDKRLSAVCERLGIAYSSDPKGLA